MGQVAATMPADPEYPKINLAVGYQVDPNWPAKPLPYEWGGVSGVAVDAKDQVWIANRGKVPIQAFTPGGKLIEAWGEGLFKAPHGLRIDRDGNLWTTDAHAHVVQKWTPKGKLLLNLGIRDQPGEDDRHFNRPTDIALSPAGDLFISDGYANNRVVHCDAQGRFIKAWGRLGVQQGEFSLPHSIGMDSHGRLYVCDRNNVRVQVFDQKGTFLEEWRHLLVPWGIWITPKDEILLCGSSTTRWGGEKALGVPPKDQLVMKFNTEGRLLELWMLPSCETGKEQPGQLNWLHGIAADSHGNLYLGDVKGNRLQKFVRLSIDRKP